MPCTTALLIGANLLFAALTLGGPPVAAQPFPPPGLPSHPNTAVQEHMRHGNDAMSRGHWEAAVAAYAKALRIDSELVEAQTNMGMAYYFRRNIPAAVGALEQALDMQPDRIDAAHGLGLALYDGGDLDGAIEAFRKATRLNAQAYYNLGNAQAAAQAYDRYLVLVPGADDAAEIRDKIAALRRQPR